MSRNNKIKSGWSRESGSGFVMEDIIDVISIGKKIEFIFGWGKQTLEIKELNLRETEELIKFCKGKVGITYHEIKQSKCEILQ